MIVISGVPWGPLVLQIYISRRRLIFPMLIHQIPNSYAQLHPEQFHLDVSQVSQIQLPKIELL